MGMIIATLLLPGLMPLMLLIAMWPMARRYGWSGWSYRIVFALLAALLAPTLVLAGHTALPCPTVGGIVLVAMQLEWIGELEGYPLVFGIKRVSVLLVPFLLTFIGFLFIPTPGRRYGKVAD